MDRKEIELETLKLVSIDFNNKDHLQFLKELFQNSNDSSMNFLGDLSSVRDEYAFIIVNDDMEKIGYFSITDPVVNVQSLLSSGAYYAILPKYRNKGYATRMLEEVSDYILKNIDMLVLSINKENIASRKVAEKNGFKIIFEDEEDMLYAKYAKTKVMNK